MKYPHRNRDILIYYDYLSTSISTVLFTELLGEGGVGVATAVMTVVVLIFGEITPKSYAKSHAESVALFMANPLWILIKCMTPIVFLFKILQNAMKPKTEQPTVTEDELNLMKSPLMKFLFRE